MVSVLVAKGGGGSSARQQLWTGTRRWSKRESSEDGRIWQPSSAGLAEKISTGP